jgi:retron-type reverse transcriptase
MSREDTGRPSRIPDEGRRPRRPQVRNVNDPERVPSESESRSRLHRDEPFEANPGIQGSFLLQHIASPNNLMVAWNYLAANGGQAAGPDEISFDISMSMAWRIVRDLSADILAGTYRPGPTREVRIPRPGRSDRIIEIPNVRDRMIGRAIARALKPLFVTVLTRFYGVGREHIFARLKVEAETSNRFYILQDDIQNCFPTANRGLASSIVRQSSEGWCRTGMPAEEFGIVQLIIRIIYGFQGENQSTGLTQGSTLSPLIMELLLHVTVDATFQVASSTNTTLHRYVDDICVQAQSPSDALEAMDAIRNTVNQNGQSLKGQSTVPMDLRTNQSDDTVLGLMPVWENGQLTFSLTDRAWLHLREQLEECLLLAVPHRAVKRTVEGWINSITACIRTSDQDAIRTQIIRTMIDSGVEPVKDQDIRESIREASTRWQQLIRTTQTPNSQSESQ